MNKSAESIGVTRVFTIRIPEVWYESILEIAARECRTKNSVAKQAIKEFLSNRKQYHS
jgi:predicted transcriptional regulator